MKTAAQTLFWGDLTALVLLWVGATSHWTIIVLAGWVAFGCLIGEWNVAPSEREWRRENEALPTWATSVFVATVMVVGLAVVVVVLSLLFGSRMSVVLDDLISKGMVMLWFALFGLVRLQDGFRERERNLISFEEYERRNPVSRRPYGSLGPPRPRSDRTIPQDVKIEVSVRDGGRCRKCGSTADLQYDHIKPYSLGGTSFNPDNIQLLCGRCNRRKGARYV